MTIAKYIVDLLKEYGKMQIDINHVADGADKYGLFRSPNRNIQEHNDGSYEITEGYQFFVRQSTVSPSERMEVDEFLEELTYWADDLGTVYEFPQIDGNRRILSMEITGNPYPMETDSKDTLYQISLTITYEREREV